MFINVCHIQMYMNSLFKVDAPHAWITNIKDDWAMKPLKTRFGFIITPPKKENMIGFDPVLQGCGTALLALHSESLSPPFFYLLWEVFWLLPLVGANIIEGVTNENTQSN